MLFAKFCRSHGQTCKTNYRIFIYVFQPMNVSGWGLTKHGGGYPSIPFSAILTVISNAECVEIAKSVTVTKTNICTATRPRGSVAEGDSGSPAIWYDERGKAYQLGIASTVGPRDAPIEFPGIYTRVSEYLDWIKEVVGEY